MEDDLRWKTTFDRVYSILPEKKCLRLLTLTTTVQLTLNRKSYQLSKPEIEFHMMEEMYAALCMCTRKDDIFRQRRLNHSGVGGGIAFRRVYPARAYSTLVVLVN